MNRWRPYPKYKDSGIEWLGEIPSDWRVLRAKLCSRLNMGQSPSSEDCNMDGIGLPFLQGNAEFGTPSPFPKLFCEAARKITEKDDLLISVRAPVGALNVADQRYGIGRGLCAITPNSRHLDHRFSWYLLQHVRTGLKLEATGSTYEAVSVEDVGNLLFVLPSSTEQHSIATFLDRETARIDGLIANKQRQIELLQEKRIALISHAVTKGLDPNVKMKDSGIEWLGEIPSSWSTASTKRHFDIQLGKMLQNNPASDTDKAVPYLKAVHVLWGIVNIENLPYMWANSSEIRQYGVRKGDLLVCEGGEAGRASIVYDPPDYCIIQNALHRVCAKSSGDLSFLMYILNSVSSVGWLDVLCSKATIAHFTREKFADLRIPLPEISEQRSIAAFLDRETAQIDALIEKIKTSIDLLREYRTALISAAVTGKIDVREEMGT